MKKILFMTTLLLLVLFCGCSVKQQQMQDIDSNINQLDGTISALEEYGLKKLTFPDIKGFRLHDIYWVNDDSILVILNDRTSKNRADFTKRVYYTTLTDIKPQLVYEGPFLGNENLKRLKNGDLLLSGTDKALRIETQTFTVIETIQFPEGSFEADISHDGKKIAYVNDKGLFVDTIPSSKPILLFERIDSEKEKKAPTEPKWSEDGQILCYAVIGNEPFKYVFVTPDGKQIFEYAIEAHGFGWWFGDDQKFVSVSLGENFGMTPLLAVIDVNNKAVYETEKDGIISIRCQPYRNHVLYLQSKMDKLEELGHLTERLILFDTAMEEEKIITPDFKYIFSYELSPSGKIALIGNYDNPENEYNIYLIEHAHSFEKQ